MKIPCERCRYDGNPTLKMGGVLCGQCRIILYYAGSKEFSVCWSFGSKDFLKVMNSKLYKIVK